SHDATDAHEAIGCLRSYDADIHTVAGTGKGDAMAIRTPPRRSNGYSPGPLWWDYNRDNSLATTEIPMVQWHP
ncbi:hypothetical protein HAX54_023055, partial [Datura stramonium]|nr:hypothetical protein [Datura stramonium]